MTSMTYNHPDVLWHITTEKNYYKIANSRLLIAGGNRNSGFGQYAGRKQLVFLTDNPDYIVATQTGIDWFNRHHAQIIEVNVENLILCHYDVHEFCTNKDVPLHYLRTIKLQSNLNTCAVP